MNLITPDFYTQSLELIVLIITVVIDVFLAIVVYRSDPKNDTNFIFSLLTLCTVLWLFVTYGVRVPSLLPHELIMHRLGIFFAAPLSYLFFLLAHTMPSKKLQLSRLTFLSTLILTLLMMLFNISPYAFVRDIVTNGVSAPVPGPALIPFSIISTVFSILAIYFLIKKYLKLEGVEKKQVGYVLLGIIIMLSLIIFTILIPILVSSSLQFLPFAPLYALIFLGLTAYAITKYQLFDIKVLLTQALTLVMCLILFAKLFGEESINARIVDIFVLGAMIGFGYLLVRSVRREVGQRETIEIQKKELETSNAKQENLLHFISHEIKGYLTKGQNAFAGIVEGDYGETSPQVKELAQGALGEMRKGVSTVMDILDASNLKKGTMSFNKKPFDLKTCVVQVSNDAKWAALRKGLKVETQFDPNDQYTIVGDEEKICRHVLRNLIDNSVRYTPSGSVTASLSREGIMVRFTVSDTGVGISPEDMSKLFTEGGHGKDSIKVNVDSTGYGLFVAKQVTDVHGGKIAAFSEGPGKGSTFTVDLPAAQ